MRIRRIDIDMDQSSLHYYVWDLGNKDPEYCMGSEFVILSESKTDDPLLLNLLEMWCSLILQTLTKNALIVYLPPGTIAPYAGSHLNVALPLNQSTNSNQIPEDSSSLDIHHSDDSLVREYYRSLQIQFRELRYSENPIIQEYFRKINRENRERSLLVAAAKTSRTCKQALEGMEVRIKYNAGAQYFLIHHFMFRISLKWVRLPEDEPIKVRCELAEDIHEHIYAKKSLPSDPASRLGVYVTGKAKGNDFAGWISSDGEMDVYKINTFVDRLEGVKTEESMTLARRWIPRYVSAGVKEPYYT
jgi:hypothetical protein